MKRLALIAIALGVAITLSTYLHCSPVTPSIPHTQEAKEGP